MTVAGPTYVSAAATPFTYSALNTTKHGSLALTVRFKPSGLPAETVLAGNLVDTWTAGVAADVVVPGRCPQS